MMKPSVGLTLLTSSFMIFLTMVVFPALSSPLAHMSLVEGSEVGGHGTYSIRTLISLSLSRAFLRIDSIL